MAEKVANGFVILQRKLQELESDINKLITDPAQADDVPYHQQVFEEIERRIVYLKHLLSAEMKVRHEQPEYLHHLAETLEQLETNLFSWAAFWEMPGAAVDAQETCSCTYSCFNEENDNTEAGEVHDVHSDLECENTSAVKGEEGKEEKEKETMVAFWADKKRMAITLLLPATFVTVVLAAAGFSIHGFHRREGLNELLRPT